MSLIKLQTTRFTPVRRQAVVLPLSTFDVQASSGFKPCKASLSVITTPRSDRLSLLPTDILDAGKSGVVNGALTLILCDAPIVVPWSTTSRIGSLYTSVVSVVVARLKKVL